MARKLGELLVESGRLTPDQLAEALRAQRIFGGPLGAHLMQLGFIDEGALADCLAALHGVAPASRRDLDGAPADVLALLPLEFARRHRLLPFRREGSRLHVALENPSDTLALDEAASLTGLEVVPHVAPEAVLRQALARLDPAAAPRAAAGGGTGAGTSLAELGRRLARAESRDDVLEAVLAATAAALPRAGLFLVRGREALLWAARGYPAAGTGRSLALAQEGLLGRAAEGRGLVTASAADRALAEALGAGERDRLVAVPIRLKGRVVVLLCGEPSPGGGEAPWLERVAKLAALALETVLLRRKILAEAGVTPAAPR